MGPRKKRTSLDDIEIARFMEDATKLHETLCRPLIDLKCDHKKSLDRLHDALLQSIKEITGAPAPWIYRSWRAQ